MRLRQFRKFFRKTPRSGRMPVPEAHPHIVLGDEARARQDWRAAAAAYRAAVEAQPELWHIWIQLGHALKESDEPAGAVRAYARAAALRFDDSEPHVFLGHLTKQMGKYDQAIGHFMRALYGKGYPADTPLELLEAMGRAHHGDRAALLALLRHEIATLPPRANEAPLLGQLRSILSHDIAAAEQAEDGDRPTLVFDISDLIAYYANARLPTGIQRVQIETIEGALQRAGDVDIRLCCFIDGRDEWLELPLEQMRAIARLSTSGGDSKEPEWVAAIERLRLFLSLTTPFTFPRGASLINLGTSWWLQNYFLFVRHAKQTRGIRYIPFVHDMIPIMTPEHCTRGLTQDFISWVIGVFDHADHFLVNSEATRRDLLSVAETLGHAIDPQDIAVIPLNTDFRKAGVPALPDNALDRWGLAPGGFVLFVSTIESRKGHMIAFDAWEELIRRHGAQSVPKLVCVGNRGWLNDQIYDRLSADPVLGERVSMLSRLSDEELALLYRTCRFTIYPSLYEGWGLPVTESLCTGKVPLISDAASLPEAGGDFAVYAEAGSVPALTEAAERLMLDDAYRAGLEARITAEFRPRSWEALARQIGDELARFADRDATHAAIVPEAPLARLGAWHSLSRNLSTRIWRGIGTGESFRSDLGWLWPEGRGCRIREDGGALTMTLAPHARLRLFVQLLGDERADTRWCIRTGNVVAEGPIAAGEQKWAWFDLPAAEARHLITLHFAAPPADDQSMIAYFVRGFFLCEVDDTVARMDFLEAVTLGRLDVLDAYREG